MTHTFIVYLVSGETVSILAERTQVRSEVPQYSIELLHSSASRTEGTLHFPPLEAYHHLEFFIGEVRVGSFAPGQWLGWSVA